jgi:hypothetical protein
MLGTVHDRLVFLLNPARQTQPVKPRLLDSVHAEGQCFRVARDAERTLSSMPQRDNLSQISLVVSGDVRAVSSVWVEV